MAARSSVPPVLDRFRTMGVRSASELVAESTTNVDGRLFPVREDLAGLLPLGGLRRGSTVAVLGSTSVLLALLAEATVAGSWAAVVGRPDLGVLAADELGVDISRLALVPEPGPDVVPVLGTLLDGIDLVAVSAGCLGGHASRRQAVARDLSARARHRGSVLLVDTVWPGAEVTVRHNGCSWSGLDRGSGYLRAQRVHLQVEGRGHADGGHGFEIALPAGPDLPREPWADVPVPEVS